MIAYDSSLVTLGERYFCACAGRRDGVDYAYSEQDIIDRFGANIKIIQRVPDVLAGTMGNIMYIANFKNKEELDEFYAEVTKVRQ